MYTNLLELFSLLMKLVLLSQLIVKIWLEMNITVQKNVIHRKVLGEVIQIVMVEGASQAPCHNVPSQLLGCVYVLVGTVIRPLHLPL